MRHMLKRYALCLILSAALCGALPSADSEAADFVFFWSASTDPSVNAYGVYQRTGDSPYVKIDEVGVDDLDDPGAPAYLVTGLAAGGTYRFAATSISGSGAESDLHSRVCITVNSDVVECGGNEDDGATVFISCFIDSAAGRFFTKPAGSGQKR